MGFVWSCSIHGRLLRDDLKLASSKQSPVICSCPGLELSLPWCTFLSTNVVWDTKPGGAGNLSIFPDFEYVWLPSTPIETLQPPPKYYFPEEENKVEFKKRSIKMQQLPAENEREKKKIMSKYKLWQCQYQTSEREWLIKMLFLVGS